jgi:hypothetical protein
MQMLGKGVSGIQQLTKHNPVSPDINLLPHADPKDSLLRRHPGPTPSQIRDKPLPPPGHPKISQDNLAILLDKQVVQLDVEVDEAIQMEVVDGFCEAF